jgi:hypothetical protein
VLAHDGNKAEVLMPGLLLSQVRYTGDGYQNIWDYPRLYVDGDSWVWKYAIEVILGQLAPKEAHNAWRDHNVSPRTRG